MEPLGRAAALTTLAAIREEKTIRSYLYYSILMAASEFFSFTRWGGEEGWGGDVGLAWLGLGWPS